MLEIVQIAPLVSAARPRRPFPDTLRAAFSLAALVAVLAAGLRAQAPDRITQPIDPTRMQALPNHHPMWANAANDAGPAPADLQLNQLTLVLARSLQQQQAFEQFLADQQNPASPAFHRWLTAAEVGRRFGISGDDLAAVRAWLESQGLRVNWIAPGRNFIGFAGSAEDVSRAFQTELHYYNVNAVKRLSVASDPMIPQALAPVIEAVRGLYDIQDRPAHLTREAQTAPDFSNGGNHFITPGDFATIYDLPSNLSGAGVTIGIVGWSFVNPADLENFRQQTGTSFADPAEVAPTEFGGMAPSAPSTAPPACNNCLSGQEEATLDVLRAASVAPDAGVLLVASAESGANDGIGAATQYLIQTTPTPAQIVNISFGDCESDAGPSGVSYWNKLFEQAAAEGISVFVSSGDSGAAGCEDSFTAPSSSPQAVSPNYICASIYATCVGGTDFNDAGTPSTYWSSSNRAGLASALSYIPEGAWNEPLSPSSNLQVAASGGGVSEYIATPAWQKGVTGVPSAASGRYTPDVSFSASCREGYFGCLAAAGGSCVADSSGNYSFVTFCGTSAATPGMAGIAALLDQQMGGRPQGNLNPQLYALQSSSPSAFHDVTIGSSGVSNCTLSLPSVCNNTIAGARGLAGGEPGYLIGPGYDEVTGLGSLDVQAFLQGFAVAGAVVSAPPGPPFTVSGAAVSIASGATTGNTSTITVTPLAGFTGTVVLTAQVTASPEGARDLPAVSFGSTNSVNIAGGRPAVATMTISTVANASSLAQNAQPEAHWYATGGAALACLLLFWIPGRRNWRGLLCAVALLAALAIGATGCTASIRSAAAGPEANTGTTAGSYTVTVTGTSGSTVVTAPITLIVQ